jgi:predicted Fe-S protein YdhL (DUF1289 family)
MKLRNKFGGWWCGLALSVVLVLPLSLPCAAAQRPPKNPPPRPAPERKADRPPKGNGGGNAPRFNQNKNGARVTPPNGQERWKNMTPQERQRVLQNEERLRHLPPAQQQVLRDRAQVWNRMTPEQREHIRTDVLPRWRQMPPDRKQAIQQRLRVLQNMPEAARNQRLNDPNFTRGMSEEDRSTLRDLSHLHVGGAPEPPSE